jgi:undecaprenyl-diphosphatase
MAFLHLLEGIRNPVLDALFQGLTLFGEETMFILFGLLFFWCINKRQGYYLFVVGIFGNILNQFLKLTFRIPRPWKIDPNFEIWEGARDAATGYSFPSGHTQNAVGTFGVLAHLSGSRLSGRLRSLFVVGCIGAAIAVAFSRMLLGVHTPLDVFVSIGIALLLLVLGHFFFRRERSTGELLVAIGAMTAVAFLYVLYAELFPFPASTDPENLLSARENAWTLFGAAAGVLVMTPIERKYVRFETKAPLLGQILKFTLGAALAIAVKELLKLPLGAMFGQALFPNAIRYFLLVLFCGCVWPLTFPYFAKIGEKSKK